MNNVLITPSFCLDLDRCERLVHSVQRFVGGFSTHYLLIDKAELPLFEHLASESVVLLTKESLLPFRHINMPWLSKWWFSLSCLPVRGWVFQQLCKLAVAEHIDADAYVFADSDVEFVRPFNMNDLWRGDDLRLAVQPRGPMMYHDKRYLNWYNLAAKLFDITDQSQINRAYIAQINAFRRDTCLQMFNDIQTKTGKPWYVALARQFDMSEFVLYGCYVDYAMQGQGHWRDESKICHSSWFYNIESSDDIQHYLDELQAHHVAVHVQSNLGFSPKQYSDWVNVLTGGK